MLRVSILMAGFIWMQMVCTASEVQTYVKGELLIKVEFTATIVNMEAGRIPCERIKENLKTAGVMEISRIVRSNVDEPIVGLNRWYVAKIDHGLNELDVVREISLIDGIEHVQTNDLLRQADIPNDTKFGAQFHWNLMEAPSAWDITHGSLDVIVAVIDSGSDFGHEDLASSFWINADDPVNSIDDDGNGYVDDYFGWDFNGNDNDPDNVDDLNIHGTHVAGIVGAMTNNGTGVASGTWGCPVMTCKVFPNEPDGGASVDDVVEAIYYAVENGASVINLSLGGVDSQAQEDACWFAHESGIVVVAAAGNGGNDGIGDPGEHYPAAYDGVIGVGNTTQLDIKSASSNYGPWVDLYAPGSQILSTEPANFYKKESGTSMSSPVAASLAALLKTKYPSLTPDEIETRMESGCVNLNSQNPTFYNQLNPGRINFYQSLVDSPVLKIEQIIVLDSSGNNNNQADRGETVEIEIKVSNNSWKQGDNVHIEILSVSGAVITDGTASYGTIASQEKKWNSDELSLTINTDAPGTLNAVFRLIADGGYTTDIPMSLLCNYPYPSMPGFPFYTLEGFNAGPKCGDIDNDGQNEIVCVGNDGLVHALELDGTYVNGFPVINRNNQPLDMLIAVAPPALADLDNDGTLEIIISDYIVDEEYKNPNRPDQGSKHRIIGRISVIHSNGTSMTGFPFVLQSDDFVDKAETPISKEFKAAPCIADVNNDGQLEIVAGNYNNLVYVISRDGTVMTGWPKDVGMDVFATAAVGDVDDDGSTEIVVATKDDVEPLDSGSIFIFDGAGNVKYGPYSMPNQIYSAPVLLDMNSDGDLEIIFGFGDFSEAFPSHGLQAIHHTGAAVNGFPVATESSVYGSPAIGDLNSDGVLEIVVADLQAKVYAFHLDGSILSQFPVQTSNDPDPDLISISSSPVIADIDNSGGPEIIVGCADSKLYILNSSGAFLPDTPIALDGDGFASPTVMDVNNDGDIEILMNARSIYVLSATGSFDENKQFWTTFHADNRNTGFKNFEQGFNGVHIELNDTDFVANDDFNLVCRIGNLSTTPVVNTDLYVVLDVMSFYWFYPSWSSSVDWQDITQIDQGVSTIPILRFDWPSGNFGSFENIRFWAAIINSSGQVFGDYSYVTFGYH